MFISFITRHFPFTVTHFWEKYNQSYLIINSYLLKYSICCPLYIYVYLIIVIMMMEATILM